MHGSKSPMNQRAVSRLDAVHEKRMAGLLEGARDFLACDAVALLAHDPAGGAFFVFRSQPEHGLRIQLAGIQRHQIIADRVGVVDGRQRLPDDGDVDHAVGSTRDGEDLYLLAGAPLQSTILEQGVLVALSRQPDQVLDERERRLLDWFAREIDTLLSDAPSTFDQHGLLQALTAERERLLKIQVAVRQVLESPEPEGNLDTIADAVQMLGWQRVALALFDDQRAVRQLLTRGIESHEEPEYQRTIVPADIWARYEAGQLEDYRLDGLYFVPSDDGGTDHWTAGDVLFAVLRVGQGNIAAVIRMEQPLNNRRPTADSLRPLDVLMSQAAYLVENDRLLTESSRTAEMLADQLEELSMIHRADRELGAHLNVDRVMALTMDWALRRTRADAGLLALMTNDRRGLIPFTSVGLMRSSLPAFDEDNPLPLGTGVIGRVAKAGIAEHVSVIDGEQPDPYLPDAQAEIALPLAMRGETLGAIALFSRQPDLFDENSLSFMERLARRAAVALDNARLFRQSEQLADDMSVLYSASRAITSTLDRDEVLQRIAQSMAVALDCSSAIITDYAPETRLAQVLTVYRVGTVRDAVEKLPETGQSLSMDTYPRLMSAIQAHQPLVLRREELVPETPEHTYLIDHQIYAMIAAPLVAQNELLGLVLIVEGRRDRMFTANEVFKVQTLSSQASVAMRQALLYNEVLELETIKSEMIRMASHDLRNPLNNIMGYVELVGMSADETGDEELQDYVDSLRRSAKTMQSLIDDLLTLERVESEREIDWQEFDLGALALEVIQVEEGSAKLKQQALAYHRDTDLPEVFGSVTQLRQVISNLVGNAIKYTPEGGAVDVYYARKDNRLQLWVTDNGYGISPERQARLFERFYRAREPGTDHIPGTGLGLSLVRTVVERHGGEVWFESETGVGSTFGFWLPPSTRTVRA